MVLSSSDQNSIKRFSDNVNLVLTLDHGGRAGSVFFQCLFDAHEQIVACPLIHYVYSYWQSEFGDKREVSLEQAHEFFAHSSYSRLLYHEPEDEYKELIRKIGGDETAPFDRARFRTLIDVLYKGSGIISRRDAITRCYAAYALCRDFDLKKAKYISINDAVSSRDEDLRVGFSIAIVDKALEDFPNAIILALLRDPRAQFASTRHQMLNEFGNNYAIRFGNWWRSLGKLLKNEISLNHGPAHFCLMYQVAAFRALIKKWCEGNGNWMFLRNEDFNTNFVPTMSALCEALDVAPDPEWIKMGGDYKAKMMGRPWAGTGAYSSRYQKVTDGPLANDKDEDVAKTEGPNKYVTQRWQKRLTAYEQENLERLFYYELQYFDYPFLISAHQKFPRTSLFKTLQPWSGELPSVCWLKSAPNKQTFLARIFYLLTLWPFYLLARYKLLSYERRDEFFSKDMDAAKDMDEIAFIGYQRKEKAPNIDTPILRIISDKVNIKLLFACLKACMFSCAPIRITLIDKEGTPLLHKLLSLVADVELCAADLGDYTNEKGKHLFTDSEALLLRTHERLIKRLKLYKLRSLPPAAIDHKALEAFISRYVVSRYADKYARSILACSYILNMEEKADLVFLERHIASAHWSEKIREITNVEFYSEPSLFVFDFKNVLRLLVMSTSIALKKKAPSIDVLPQDKKLAVQSVIDTDLDWVKYSGLDYEDLIYLIENKEKHADKNFTAYQEKGLNILYFSDFQIEHPDQLLKQESLQAISSCINSFFTAHGLLINRIRAASISAFYSTTVLKWLYFYRKMGVLGHVNVSDTNLDGVPRMHALEYCGGVDLAFQFSGTGYHAYMDCKPAGRHQYVAWGPLTENMINDCDIKVPYRIRPEAVFYAGNMKLHFKDMLSPEQKVIIRNIRAHKGKYKFLIMDSATTHLKILSRHKRENFYDAVLYVIKKRPDDLFIIKPQRDAKIRKDQEKEFDKLQEEGRVIITPAPGVFHYLLPVIDLVIGMPIYASCIMESCAGEKPVICFDETHWPHLMLAELPKSCLVSTDKALFKAVEQLLDNSSALNSINKKIDPYLDQRGHERFAYYLELWVRHIRECGSADKALPKVKTDYYKKWPLPNKANRGAS